MSGTIWLGAAADMISATVCLAAPFVLIRLLGERQFTAHRPFMFLMATTIGYRGVLHVAFVVNVWRPIPVAIAWLKVIVAVGLLAVAWVLIRRVGLFLRMVDQAQTEADYEAIVGILKRLRVQARKHGHPRI